MREENMSKSEQKRMVQGGRTEGRRSRRRGVEDKREGQRGEER